MANLTAYPIGTPKSEDLLIGTSVPIPGTNQKPTTKNFSIRTVSTLMTQGYVEVTKTLTNAEWLGLASTSVEIIPSPGQGKAIQVILAHVKYFPSGDNFSWTSPLTLNNATSGAVSSVTQGVLPTSYTDVDGDGDMQIFTISGSDVSLNGAINFGCASGATIGGGGTLSITIRYQVI
tara:strand:- start:709 stop:1239 length:531 start_codon:yes stop_codon:yes gene_type:complete